MSFEQLKQKVTQAEQALEAHERHLAADWRQFKASWKSAWTPGRIVVAGLLSGATVGFAEPMKKLTGSGVLQMLASLSSLVASGGAQQAAQEAEHAADTAALATVDPAAAAHQARVAIDPPQPVPAQPVAAAAPPSQRPYELPETFRDSGQL